MRHKLENTIIIMVILFQLSV